MKERIWKLLNYIQQRKELSRAVSTDMPSEDAVEIVKRDLDWEKYLKNKQTHNLS